MTKDRITDDDMQRLERYIKLAEEARTSYATPAQPEGVDTRVVDTRVMARMIICIMQGEPFAPNGAAESAVFERLRTEIAEMQARGEIVDIPAEWPDL